MPIHIDDPNKEAPVCVRCGSRMRLVHASLGDFWGCTKYPDCKGKLPIELEDTPEKFEMCIRREIKSIMGDI